jgi:hypothetical protein
MSHDTTSLDLETAWLLQALSQQLHLPTQVILRLAIRELAARAGLVVRTVDTAGPNWTPNERDDKRK